MTHNNKNYTIPLIKEQPTNTVNLTEVISTPLTCSCNYTEADIIEKATSLNEIYLSSSHIIRQDIENETLPESQELFEEHMELQHDLLQKQYSILDGDFTHTPPTYFKQLLTILEDYADRFSTTKLDIETTDIYEAELNTLPDKKVIQQCRRLPQQKFDFAYEALEQLKQAGVVEPSTSEWRSNVVLVPKPESGTDIRQNTKADALVKQEAKLYRICLDFRQLNEILVFPEQSTFTTVDQILNAIKKKIVISLDR
jgi:hypothetical protein